MRSARMIALAVSLTSSPALAAGFAHNANFVVFTPAQPNAAVGQRFAEQVLAQAERFRTQIAQEWFGESLDMGAGRTVVSVDLAAGVDRGITWAKDHPDRTFHNIYLTTSAENAAGATLQHEIAHAVFATRYPHPHRLPTWLEEGIASRYDDTATAAARQRTISSWRRPGRAPRLASLFDAGQMSAHDDHSYAAATSLVSFLLTRGDRPTLLRFGESLARSNYDEALQTHYRINSVAQLQSQWEGWLHSPSASATTAQTQSFGTRPYLR